MQPTLFDIPQPYIHKENNAESQKVFDVPTGLQLRDIGIQKAVDHADAVHDGWSDKAYSFLLNFIKSSREFMTEDIREAAIGIVPEPLSNRAWGSVVLKAARNGLIYKSGIVQVKNPKAHMANANVWKVK